MAHRTRQLWPAVALAIALSASACGVELRDDQTLVVTGDDIQGGLEGPGGNGGTPTTEPRKVEILPPVDLDVTGADGSELNRVATTAISDLEAYWADEYPEVYGDEYVPLRGGLFAYDSGTDAASLPCPAPDISYMMGNAFYCPTDDAVAWDQEQLMPFLAETYGEFTVAVVLGHEWGHVIQGRAGNAAPSVYTELQADCFAGAWVAHVHNSDKAHFRVDAAVLDQALSGVLSLRDAPGTTSEDANAHGSGFDRVGAFQDGYQNDAVACKDYFDGGITPYQFPFRTEDDFSSEGNLGLDEIQESGVDSLEAYWADIYPELSGGEDWEPLGEPVAFDPSDPPTCNGTVVDEYRLFLCQPERWVGYTNDLAEEAYSTHGDFGVATLVGSQYGLAVQQELGDVPDDVVVMTLRGDCFVGAWAGAMVPDENGNTERNYELVLSPGDLDEAVGVLLGVRGESDRVRQGPAFDRVGAFRTGVLDGPEACLDLGA